MYKTCTQNNPYSRVLKKIWTNWKEYYVHGQGDSVPWKGQFDPTWSVDFLQPWLKSHETW